MMGCFAVMEMENTTLKPLRNAKIIVDECLKIPRFDTAPYVTWNSAGEEQLSQGRKTSRRHTQPPRR